jgi:hypothetical protein
LEVIHYGTKDVLMLNHMIAGNRYCHCLIQPCLAAVRGDLSA